MSDRKEGKPKKNIFQTAFFIIGILALCVTILLLPLKLVVFNLNYYKVSFEKNGVYEQIEFADQIANNTLMFFEGKAELKYFNDEEASHMEDVKVLLNKLFKAQNIFWLVFLVSLAVLFFVNQKEFLDILFQQLFLAGLITFVLMALLLLVSLNFSIAFEGFHQAFFPQGNYIFPENSTLITLFPEAFFKVTLTKMMIVSFLVSIAVMIPQLILNKIRS